MINIYKKKIYKAKAEGFTLVELLVSLAIFGIISVLMSNIVISMSRFSLDNERRNDLLSQLDNSANIIKNDLRGAESLGICTTSGNASVLYRVSKINTSNETRKFGLYLQTNTLRWYEMNEEFCSFKGAFSSPAPLSEFLTNSSNIKISTMSITKADDGNPTNPNTIVYVKIEACDSDTINSKKKIFDCTINPYRYIFSVTTRNIQS